MQRQEKWQSLLPGMRAIKTALAVTLCVIIASLTSWLSPFFMTLAAIITMQVSTVEAFRIGRTRILGTAVGVGIGLGFALIQPDNALLCGLGILLIIVICNRLNWNGAVQIAAFVFMAIMVNMNGQNPFAYSATRMLDTFSGVAVGIAVNYFVFPYNNLGLIHDQIYQVKSYIESELDPETGVIALEPLRTMLLKLRDEINLYKQEARIQRKDRAVLETYENAFQLYWDAFEHFKHIDKVAEELKSTSVEDYIAYDELQAVYRFHWKRIQKDLETVVLPPNL